MREWTAANRESVNARRARSRVVMREELASKQRAYYASLSAAEKRARTAARRAHVTAQRREYRAAHRAEVAALGHQRRAREQGAAGATYTTAGHIAARWAMWGDCCRYCGAASTCTDHRIPLSRGGSHWPANLVPACGPCNNRKYNKTESEFVEVVAA